MNIIETVRKTIFSMWLNNWYFSTFSTEFFQYELTLKLYLFQSINLHGEFNFENYKTFWIYIDFRTWIESICISPDIDKNVFM